MDTPEKFNSNDSTSNNTLISNDGISIMSSIAEIAPCCSNKDDNRLAAHEKPGYLLCSYVESFINTELGPVPVVKAELARMIFFQPFMSGVVSDGTDIWFPPDFMPSEHLTKIVRFLSPLILSLPLICSEKSWMASTPGF